jgi:catechol 2,3-dioxygenase-like lactoylglutathione lyase family enzyme
MPVLLNHTIVNVRDRQASATFYADILGLPEPGTFGPFQVLDLGNEVSLDFMDDPGPIHPQHYAFLVSEAEFDEIHARIQARGLTYWADPFHRETNRINTHDGGRGLYWSDPDGHNLEIITRPYGSGAAD